MTAWLPCALAVAPAAAAAVLAARLRAAQRLAAHASHELRGPLTAAGLALESLVRAGDLAADRADALASQLDRARRALDDLVAAPRCARAPDHHEPFVAAGLVAQLARTWRPVAALRGAELTVAIAADAGAAVLHADRTRLLQAAGNLVANALEHGSGPVELRARVLAGALRLEVRDGGPGLPAPVVELVRRRPRGPHGHGLAIAAGIAERHGGRVVAAPSPAGAAMVLELPLAPAHARRLRLDGAQVRS